MRRSSQNCLLSIQLTYPLDDTAAPSPPLRLSRVTDRLCFGRYVAALPAMLTCTLCGFEAAPGNKGHTVRTCPLWVLECRHGLLADNPMSRRGRCPNERCNHNLHCSLCGLIEHTRVTLKLHAARWKLSHNGLSVISVARPAVLAGKDFVCAAMGDRDPLDLVTRCMRCLWQNRW